MAGIRRSSDLGTNGIANHVDGSITGTDIALNTIPQGRLSTSVPLSGFRNAFINSTYAVDQRGKAASHTITAGAALSYTVDRWYEYCTGANVTAARNTYTPSFALPVIPYYYYTFTGAANNTGVGFGQRIESIAASQLAGQFVSLSGIIWSSASTTVTWTAYYANTVDSFGTLASPTRTQIATGTFSTSPIGTYPPASNAVSASILIPLAAVNGIEIVLSCSSLTAGQTLSISCMQLEISPKTPFEQRPYGIELALCQRYYEVSNGVVQCVGGSTGFGGNTYWSWVPYMVEKRGALNYTTSTTANGVRITDTTGVANQITYWKSATQYTGTTIGFEVYTTKGFGLVHNGGQMDAGLARFNWFANAEF